MTGGMVPCPETELALGVTLFLLLSLQNPILYFLRKRQSRTVDSGAAGKAWACVCAVRVARPGREVQPERVIQLRLYI